MKLTKVVIKNYRCFKDQEVSLATKTTVFIGKNGSGKSNLMSAIIRGLSFIFSRNKSISSEPFTTNGDYSTLQFNEFDAHYNSTKREFKYPIDIEYHALIDQTHLNWSYVKNHETGSLLSTRYAEALQSFLKFVKQTDDRKNHPLIAVFSDSYPHNKSNFGKIARKTVEMNGSLPWHFGYYQWNAETNCADIWQLRYIKSYNAINDFKNPIFKKKNRLLDLGLSLENDPSHQDATQWEIEAKTLEREILNAQKESAEFSEVSYIDRIIKEFSKPIDSHININSEFEIDDILVDRPSGISNHQILFEFKSGKSSHFNLLPQGYKRLLSIVFDLAYRSYALNEDIQPTGCVFIDEIELHLHPALQQDILQRFERTFPNIQFIVTTHSPLVVSNLKADGTDRKIIRLDNDRTGYSNEEVENVYGIDYATNLKEIMNVSYRPSTVDKLINAHLVLYGKGKFDAANSVLEKLKDFMGGDIPRELEIEIADQKSNY